MAMTARLVLVLLVFFNFCFGKSLNEKEGQHITINEQNSKVLEDDAWPGFPYLKQVSGLAVDGDGNLHVFHRADRVWDSQTFDPQFRLKNIEKGPIPNSTVLVIDTSNARVLYSWGANKFYIPHGITIDHFGNTWVTDVGLHQVFKFSARESEPELVIGEAFTPGSGKNHLCQPTDVAVMTAGYFFVADGYCNSRVLMFNRNGRLVKEIGSSYGMNVPHSLTLVPEHDAVCVADRENGRVLCFATGSDGSVPGAPLVSIDGQGLGRVFAIDTRGKDLFVINGPDIWENAQSVSSDHGLVLDIETGLPKTLWGPEKGFTLPHDLAVSPDGKYVYVSETDISAPKKVYKFNIFN